MKHNTLNQQLILNIWGEVIESTDTIFVAPRDYSIIEDIPFLESIFGQLRQLNGETQSEMRFNAVASDGSSLPIGMYDFTFVKVEYSGQSCIVCTIAENTEKYLQQQYYQQVIQERAINNELKKAHMAVSGT